MKWTSELPRQEGWYWVRATQSRKGVVHVYQDRNLLVDMDWYEMTVENYAKAKQGTEWSGPIPEPEND